MLHHRHELLLDARFSRIQIMNRLRYSEKRPIVSKDGSWLVSPSNWRIRVYQDAFVTILSDGQLQDITENEISPKIGKYMYFRKGLHFFRNDQMVLLTYIGIQRYVPIGGEIIFNLWKVDRTDIMYRQAFCRMPPIFRDYNI